MTKPLLFLGSSSALQLYHDAAQRQGIQVEGILDSDYYGNTQQYQGITVVGTELELSKYQKDYDFFIATNSSPGLSHARDVIKRKKLIELVQAHDIKCLNLIDPTAYTGSNVKLGHGIFIGFNSYIEHGVSIGNHSQIHYGTGISHDCVIGSNTIVQRKSGLGNVSIGNNTYIGMWVNVFSEKHITIGNNVVINQGLWVVRDVCDNETVKLTRDSVRIYRNLTKIT
jgi:UDP-3-O-[3-hydroxymyristoyl] glucosamine N-acyltransferase